jgi:hypothetical protein
MLKGAIYPFLSQFFALCFLAIGYGKPAKIRAQHNNALVRDREKLCLFKNPVVAPISRHS